MPINIKEVSIDEHSVGERWSTQDFTLMAQVITAVLMGQASHAVEILKNLEHPCPVYTHQSLINEAKERLTIKGDTEKKRKKSREHRDGLLFEIISWIAAHTKHPDALVKLPHLIPTAPGLDGLILKLLNSSTINFAIICEYKCTQNPRPVFLNQVLKKFKSYHSGERNTEILNEATALVEKIVANGTKATEIAGKIFDKDIVHYQAALTVESEHDSEDGRVKLFKNFDKFAKISQSQRIGASFVVSGGLRDFFDLLAIQSIACLDTLNQEE